MKPADALELLRAKIEEEFPGYAVIIGRQSRLVKPSLPLISLYPGPLRKPQHPNYDYSVEEMPSTYDTSMSVSVDLFTHGAPVVDGEDAIYYDSALDELMELEMYMNSMEFVEWCGTVDISVMIDQPGQDVTGLVNDASYEYRARNEITLSFTMSRDTVGISLIEKVEAIDETEYLIFLVDFDGSYFTDADNAFLLFE